MAIAECLSQSAAGDINGDGHADLLIGAYGYPSNSGKGRSYVVFGGPRSAVVELLRCPVSLVLMALNWMGKIMVIRAAFVSAAGDINGDGHADLLIGPYGRNAGKGRSYVVFGGPESW